MRNEERTILKRVFVVTSEGVAVGVLTVETLWSDLERPSMRIDVAPVERSPVIEGRLVPGPGARVHVELV